jgi:hypothetical protein
MSIEMNTSEEVELLNGECWRAVSVWHGKGDSWLTIQKIIDGIVFIRQVERCDLKHPSHCNFMLINLWEPMDE